MDIQRILEDFKGLRNIRESNPQRRVRITKTQKRERRVHHISKRNCRCLRRSPQKTLRRQWARWIRTRIRWRRKQKQHWSAQQQSQRSRQKSCKLQWTNSKKGISPDSNGIRAEDFKACDDETREMVRQIFNEIVKRNEFTSEDKNESDDKSDTQESRRGECE